MPLLITKLYTINSLSYFGTTPQGTRKASWHLGLSANLKLINMKFCPELSSWFKYIAANSRIFQRTSPVAII